MKNALSAVAILAVLVGGWVVVNNQTAAPVDLGATSGPTAVQDALGQRIVTGSCRTATSTLISVRNPLAATSTASIKIRFTVNSASSTDFIIGTSTTGYVNHGGVSATTTMSKALVALGNLAASTKINVFSGQTQAMSARAGETASFNAVYPATSAEVMVGPTDSIVGYATSTLASNGIPVVAGIESLNTCSYTLTFKKAY